MSDLAKGVLPSLGLSLLFLEREVCITLSLGSLLALTVSDSRTLYPLVSSESVTASPAPSRAGDRFFPSICCRANGGT